LWKKSERDIIEKAKGILPVTSNDLLKIPSTSL